MDNSSEESKQYQRGEIGLNQGGRGTSEEPYSSFQTSEKASLSESKEEIVVLRDKKKQTIKKSKTTKD
jgi:hypothetical protein